MLGVREGCWGCQGMFGRRSWGGRGRCNTSNISNTSSGWGR